MAAQGLVVGPDGKPRCWWAGGADRLRAPTTTRSGAARRRRPAAVRELCLEGFQSGLSWLTILRKREAFRARVRRLRRRDGRRLRRRRCRSGCSATPASSATAARSSRRSTTRGARASWSAEAGSLAAYFWRFEPPARVAARARIDRATLPSSRPPESTAVEGPEAPRLDFVGPDDRLRVHAGDGARQRSPRGLRLPRRRRGGPSAVRAAGLAAATSSTGILAGGPRPCPVTAAETSPRPCCARSWTTLG